MSLSGLPHSEIFGSKPVCGSPKLFAADHVLHRLLAPRHSPYALSSLTIETRDSRRPPPARAASRPRKSLAHCVCVVGKNYRLQDIQLSKTVVGSLPPSRDSGARVPLSRIQREGQPVGRTDSFSCRGMFE